MRYKAMHIAPAGGRPGCDPSRKGRHRKLPPDMTAASPVCRRAAGRKPSPEDPDLAEEPAFSRRILPENRQDSAESQKYFGKFPARAKGAPPAPQCREADPEPNAPRQAKEAAEKSGECRNLAEETSGGEPAPTAPRRGRPPKLPAALPEEVPLPECPFYHRDDGVLRIWCEGITANGTVILRCPSAEAFRLQWQTFCTDRYQNCELYRAAMEKYED